MILNNLTFLQHYRSFLKACYTVLKMNKFPKTIVTANTNTWVQHLECSAQFKILILLVKHCSNTEVLHTSKPLTEKTAFYKVLWVFGDVYYIAVVDNCKSFKKSARKSGLGLIALTSIDFVFESNNPWLYKKKLRFSVSFHENWKKFVTNWWKVKSWSGESQNSEK